MKPPSPAGFSLRNQPSVAPSPSTWTPGRPEYLTWTVKSAPAGIGAAGVITSLSAGHCTPCSAGSGPVGAHAGGFGLVALTGLELDAACASGFGSSGPFGLPGNVGCLNAYVAGTPLIVIDCTVRSGPTTSGLSGST